MGDLIPYELLIAPKPSDDQSALHDPNPPTVRRKKEGEGGNEKQRKDKIFRRISLPEQRIRQETEKENDIQPQRDEQRPYHPMETLRHSTLPFFCEMG